MTPEQQVESVALLLADSYWRGRMANRRNVHGSLTVPEDMIERTAKADAWQWMGKARKALGISAPAAPATRQPEHP